MTTIRSSVIHAAVTLGLFGAAFSFAPNTQARPRAGRAERAPTPTATGTIPEHNKAIYFGYKGRVDTDFQFSKFFGSDHTVMGWFMPQYPYGNIGPIFGENGTGTWYVGQGDYRTGDGGQKDPGTPVLLIEIGNKKAKYLVPAWQAGKWVHVAVVRKGDTVSLYINGNKVTPVKDIDAETNTSNPAPEIDLATMSGGPGWKTKLRFGRRSGGPAASQAIGQAYGVLDDVAVFGAALGPFTIKQVMQKKRLTGTENNLVAGWSFETPPAAATLPAKLQSSWTKSARSYTVPVSNDRSNSDKSTFENILIIGETAVAAQLPFNKDEVWKVVQGMNDPGGSHNGYATFSYDLSRTSSDSANAPIKAVAAGKLVWYRKTTSERYDQEPFKMAVRVGADEYFSYLHFAPGSLNAKATGGTYDADDDVWRFEVADAPSIAKGEQLGLVGPKAKHLHFSGAGKIGYKSTFPIAFTDYEASDDNGATWHHVLRGHPKKGQLIKREQ
jgi:hypothetical protein